MRFEVLGPLRVVVADTHEPIQVSANRLRVVLAALLWRANQPMSVDELSEMVWDGVPPKGTAGALRALILRLRRVLGAEAGDRILTRAPGYVIELSADELDVSRFEALGHDADSANRAGHWTQASATTAKALALWRGTPLTDVPGRLLRDAWLPHLEQHHVHILEAHIEAELHLGHHDQLIPLLSDLAARYPLREHFHAQLVLALYRAGRQAEALTAYQRARRALVDELGIEPGPELRALHERVLAGDADLLTPPREATTTGPVPRQLPAAVRHFTGRDTELSTLTRLLAQPDTAGNTVVISAIGGIGKTWLALHWAHQHADRFPDGQLFVDLRGFSPDGAPLDQAVAVRGFLDALGVRADRMPVDLQAQAALYRSLVTGKRMLILLDNAATTEQVTPLLPGGDTSTVLVTSRRTLTGLLARHGAYHLPLDTLTNRDAHDLLAHRLGPARVAAEPAAVEELIELCRGLPLALGIIAGRAQANPDIPLAELAAELRDIGLDALTDEEPVASLPTVLSWSYRAPSTERTV